jgi:prepilin-type N-terminal cleavage/methylation domain-containing protein
LKKSVLRPAFTLIEILVSVLILSGSIVYALKIHSGNRELILYISERNKLSLQDSLFLSEEARSYHKDKKEAYDVIQRYFKVDNFKSRKILKEISREYYIPDPIDLISEEEDVPAAVIEEIKIKDKFSSSYFHFKINSFLYDQTS